MNTLSVPVCVAKLIVTPDNTAPGSEGRLYIQFPKEMEDLVGSHYYCHGWFRESGVVTLIKTGSPDGQVITPRRQVWWKNGVRDHGIRVNWHANVYVLLQGEVLVVVLDSPTGEPKPQLPPVQETLFG